MHTTTREPPLTDGNAHLRIHKDFLCVKRLALSIATFALSIAGSSKTCAARSLTLNAQSIMRLTAVDARQSMHPVLT